MKMIKMDKLLKKYSYNIDKIVGVDPFNFNNIYFLENGILKEGKQKSVNKEHLIATYIPNIPEKDIITYEFKLQKNLFDKVDPDTLIETKCYEDLRLDEAEEYVIKYKILDIKDDKFETVEVVVIKKRDLEEYYAPVVKQYGYIDFLTYPGYAYSVLYKESILDSNNNDLFIYFNEHDIFITLYGKGKFLQTTIVPDGLRNIYEELTSSISIKNFDYEKFVVLINKKGLDVNNYSEKEGILFNELSEIISNKFLMISNQINALSRKFTLATIDKIYMASYTGSIPGISDFANMYLGVESNDLKFDTDYNPDNIEIDQILFLSMLYAKSAYKNNDQIDNFTLHQRPPTFLYRKSGQFIITSIVSFMIAMAYPTYQYVYKSIMDIKNDNLQQQLNHLKDINHNLTKINNQLKSVLNKKKAEKEALIKYITDREKIINTIYLEKQTYLPKSLLIASLTKYLYSNNVYLSAIEFDSKKSEMIFKVYAKRDKYITNFIHSIIEGEHLIINTPGYMKKDGFYIADIIIKAK